MFAILTGDIRIALELVAALRFASVFFVLSWFREVYQKTLPARPDRGVQFLPCEKHLSPGRAGFAPLRPC